MFLLDVQKISYRYESKLKRTENTFEDVSLTFDAGKVYAILGESGAGKTTLLSLLAGLDVCRDGTILYKGTDLKTINRDRYRAKEIGLVFQQFNLLYRFNALENILVAMDISKYKTKDKKEYAGSLLDKLGIDKTMSRRKVTELSGGEQQRVAIARAISHEPPVILADEPTGSLDETNQNRIMDSLVSFARNDGKCIIISTHSKEVAAFADEVITIQKRKG
jgi:putative ABC transport system ATP-binding protein